MKEPMRLEHLLGSALLIRFLGPHGISWVLAPPQPSLFCTDRKKSHFSLPDLLLCSYSTSSCGGVEEKDEIKLRGKIV